MRHRLILVLLVALGCPFVGPAPAQAVERGPAVQSLEQAPDPSQAYRSITPRMTKKEVHQMMGKPSQSTDTLWIYTYADGTTVEVTFSKQKRVTQVVNYKKRPKK
jgi:outer membrane protein assembly factor BamE (lipoprotein component of BamABCDE complex)